MYYYSAKENSFYPDELLESYEEAGSLPTDLIEITDSVYDEFSQNKEGWDRAGNEEGLPHWVKTPPPSYDKLVEQANERKRWLLAEANEIIEPLQDALDMGIATDDEVKRLKAWKLYRIELTRIDTSLSPNIIWPERPE